VTRTRFVELRPARLPVQAWIIFLTTVLGGKWAEADILAVILKSAIRIATLLGPPNGVATLRHTSGGAPTASSPRQEAERAGSIGTAIKAHELELLAVLARCYRGKISLDQLPLIPTALADRIRKAGGLAEWLVCDSRRREKFEVMVTRRTPNYVLRKGKKGKKRKGKRASTSASAITSASVLTSAQGSPPAAGMANACQPTTTPGPPRGRLAIRRGRINQWPSIDHDSSPKAR
jgi:hypothetical protein